MPIFPMFTIFILFIAWFTYNRHRSEKIEKEREKQFWAKEEKANAVRKKDLSLLPYITISCATLPVGISPDDESLCQYEAQLQALSSLKILNLTGLSNTELKLKYGAPNLTFLTECDQNFMDLVRLMHQWGTRLYELALTDAAQQVLSQAVIWGSDIKGSYVLLAKIYQEKGNFQGIQQLSEHAEALNSLMKQPILNALKDFH